MEDTASRQQVSLDILPSLGTHQHHRLGTHRNPLQGLPTHHSPLQGLATHPQQLPQGTPHSHHRQQQQGMEHSHHQQAIQHSRHHQGQDMALIHHLQGATRHSKHQLGMEHTRQLQQRSQLQRLRPHTPRHHQPMPWGQCHCSLDLLLQKVSLFVIRLALLLEFPWEASKL